MFCTDTRFTDFNNALAGELEQLPNGSSTRSGSTTGYGALIIQVALAKGAIPLSGVHITVNATEGDEIQPETFMTDNSGKTPPIVLPAPSAVYSQTPGGNIKPYSVYNITAQLAGYYPEELTNVPVFEGITSIQPIMMIPLSEAHVPKDELYIDENQSVKL